MGYLFPIWFFTCSLFGWWEKMSFFVGWWLLVNFLCPFEIFFFHLLNWLVKLNESKWVRLSNLLIYCGNLLPERGKKLIFLVHFFLPCLHGLAFHVYQCFLSWFGGFRFVLQFESFNRVEIQERNFSSRASGRGALNSTRKSFHDLVNGISLVSLTKIETESHFHQG